MSTNRVICERDMKMTITVHTNLPSVKVQKNLNNATNALNKSLERLSTGLKINRAADDAAGLYVASNLTTQISGSKIAQANVESGTNILNTTEGNLDIILDNLNRIRDLALQASSGVYGNESRTALSSEVKARATEITRISQATEFNGIKLLDGSVNKDLRLQVGANADAVANSISVSQTVFANVSANSTAIALGDATAIETAFATATAAAQYITTVDNAIKNINERKSVIGAMQNRLESAAASLLTTIENASAAKSTIMDTDVSAETAEYTKAQILQQTSATLLLQANQLPAIALQLLAG